MDELRIIVAGSRNFKDEGFVARKIDAFLVELIEGTKTPIQSVTIISGGCRGVDTFGENYAKLRHYNIKQFLPDWATYGRGAGPIRNDSMARFAAEKNGYLLAFWDGKSAGTRSMIAIARNYNVNIRIIKITT